MPEYIIREEAMSLPVLPKEHRSQLNNVDEAFEDGWRQALENLANLPAADVVEVVRCYECIHHDEDRPFHYCRRLGRDCPNDCEFYCAFGKRKDGGQDE